MNIQGTKQRERRRQRGAAMTEAVVAIPFFIIIFACTVFAGRVYGTKIKTLNNSARGAWTQALQGCEGSEGESPMAAAGGTDELDEAEGTNEAAIANKGFGGVTV